MRLTPARCLPGLFVVLCLGLLSGCVYLRLLQLKHQLADFDRNFNVETSDGLVLTFRNPVLLDQDVESFFNWKPDTRERLNSAERWHFRWVKDRMPADGDRPPVELTLEVVFSNHQLVRLVAPETLFVASFPKPLALAALRSLGGAKVDQQKRRADSTIDSSALQAAAAVRYLTEEGVRTALGAPVETRGTADRPEWIYRFTPASARQRFGDGGVVDVKFTFDAATQRVQRMNGKTIFGSMVFDLTKTGPTDTGRMSAALVN